MNCPDFGNGLCFCWSGATDSNAAHQLHWGPESFEPAFLLNMEAPTKHMHMSVRQLICIICYFHFSDHAFMGGKLWCGLFLVPTVTYRPSFLHLRRQKLHCKPCKAIQSMFVAHIRKTCWSARLFRAQLSEEQEPLWPCPL